MIAVTAFYEAYPRSTEFDAWQRKPVDIVELAEIVRLLIARRSS